VRGLKLDKIRSIAEERMSHPVRVRGLKPRMPGGMTPIPR